MINLYIFLIHTVLVIMVTATILTIARDIQNHKGKLSLTKSDIRFAFFTSCIFYTTEVAARQDFNQIAYYFNNLCYYLSNFFC